jgi:hypothetical protein
VFGHLSAITERCAGIWLCGSVAAVLEKGQRLAVAARGMDAERTTLLEVQSRFPHPEIKAPVIHVLLKYYSWNSFRPSHSIIKLLIAAILATKALILSCGKRSHCPLQARSVHPRVCREFPFFVIAILIGIQAPSITFISGEFPICSRRGIPSFFSRRIAYLLACDSALSCWNRKDGRSYSKVSGLCR